MNVSMVTLGVVDLARATAFYEALGWVNSSMSTDSVTFLTGGDVVLGLYGWEALADDAGLASYGEGFRGVTLALNRPSRQEADAFMAQAMAAGAREVKPLGDVFWGGYSGYFADPDGHLWEVAHNPFITVDERGTWQLGGGS